MQGATQQFAGGKILAECDGLVRIVTFNQPQKMNAISIEMWDALTEILADFSVDETVRVVVLRGSGDRAFVSGADISEFGKTLSNATQDEIYSGHSRQALNALGSFPKPLIAAVRGYCLGAGLSVALRTDLRVVSDDSKFGVPAARLGISYSFDDLFALVARVGAAQAAMLLFTGSRIDAETAFRVGLAQQVVPAADLWDRAMALAREISENAPLSVMAAKAGILQACGSESRNEAVLAQWRHRCLDSADAVEGRLAFQEKRAPRFSGA